MELGRRAREARKLGRDIGTLGDDRLHHLRVKTKKLRYAAEFFRDLFPGKRADRYRKDLRKLQDVLGALNDARAAAALLAQLRAGDGKRVGSMAGGQLLKGWTSAQVALRRPEVARRWKKYEKESVRWRVTRR